jgi:hypothetical protein
MWARRQERVARDRTRSRSRSGDRVSRSGPPERTRRSASGDNRARGCSRWREARRGQDVTSRPSERPRCWSCPGHRPSWAALQRHDSPEKKRSLPRSSDHLMSPGTRPDALALPDRPVARPGQRATAFRAEDLRLNRPVVVRRCAPAGRASRRAAASGRGVPVSASKPPHRDLRRGREDGLACIVMQLVEADREGAGRGPALEPAVALSIAAQIADARWPTPPGSCTATSSPATSWSRPRGGEDPGLRPGRC